MKKLSTFTLFDKQIACGSQSLVWMEHFNVSNGDAVRLTIKSDAYVHQCQAHIERWTKDGWIMVASLPSPAMKTKHSLYVNYADSRDYTPDFAADRKWLLDMYDKIVRP